MKKIRLIVSIVALVLNAYMPFVALVVKFGSYNVEITHAVVPAIIPSVVSLALAVLVILGRKEICVPVRVITLSNVAMSIVSFAVYLLYSNSTAATIIAIVTFVSATVAATAVVKRIALRIIVPVISVLLGVAAFFFALLLALALAFGQRKIVAQATSPNGEYRVEMVSGLITTQYTSSNLELIKKSDEVYLPFVHLYPDGRQIWSGVFQSSDGLSFKDNNTVVVKGQEIKIP